MEVIIAIFFAFIVGMSAADHRAGSEVERDYSVDHTYSTNQNQDQNWSGQ